MDKEKIELLRQQAQTYVTLAKCLKGKASGKMYLKNGKKCVIMALEIQKQLDLDKTITMEYKLTA